MLREKAMQYQADTRTTPTYLNEALKSLKLCAKITLSPIAKKTILFRLFLLFYMQPFFSIKAILSFAKATILSVANDKTSI